MTQPFEKSVKKKKKSNRPSPHSLFVAAALAYFFGAPIGISLFLIGLGIIFWRVQAAAKNMEKLPPLPPKEADRDVASSSSSDASDREMESIWRKHDSEDEASQSPPPLKPTSLEDTAWGRTSSTKSGSSSAEEPFPTIWFPQEQEEHNSGTGRAESSSSLPTSTIAPASSHRGASAPAFLNASNSTRRPGLGVNLATQSGLRHAIVAMTVLGPCRALDPYQAEPLATGLPASRSNGSSAPKATDGQTPNSRR